MRRLATLCILFPLLISCATTTSAVPRWVTHTYDEVYPQSIYLAAVGSGADRDAAVDRAYTALSQVFSTAVQSTIVTSTHVGTTGGSAAAEEFSESSDFFAWGEIRTLIENLVGSEVVNTYIDADGLLYARVVMHRQKSAEHYSREIATLAQQRSALARQRGNTTDPLAAWMLVNEEIALASKADTLGAQVATLTGLQPQSMLAPLMLERKRLAANIGVNIAVVAQEEATEKRIASALAVWVTEQGFSLDPAGPYQLRVIYADETEEMAGSPYAHVRYHISGSVRTEKLHYLSFEASKRETALSEAQARLRAMESAAKAVAADLTAALAGQIQP